LTNTSITASLDQESQHGDLDTSLLVFLVSQNAEGFQVGDVGIVMVGDRRNHDRVAQQVGTADLLDARHLLTSLVFSIRNSPVNIS
jgi:hypothetical protein